MVPRSIIERRGTARHRVRNHRTAAAYTDRRPLHLPAPLSEYDAGLVRRVERVADDRHVVETDRVLQPACDREIVAGAERQIGVHIRDDEIVVSRCGVHVDRLAEAAGYEAGGSAGRRRVVRAAGCVGEIAVKREMQHEAVGEVRKRRRRHHGDRGRSRVGRSRRVGRKQGIVA